MFICKIVSMNWSIKLLRLSWPHLRFQWQLRQSPPLVILSTAELRLPTTSPMQPPAPRITCLLSPRPNNLITPEEISHHTISTPTPRTRITLTGTSPDIITLNPLDTQTKLQQISVTQTARACSMTRLTMFQWITVTITEFSLPVLLLHPRIIQQCLHRIHSVQEMIYYTRI